MPVSASPEVNTFEAVTTLDTHTMDDGSTEIMAWITTIYFYCCIFFMVYGTISNSLAFILFLRRVKRVGGSTNVYLSSLAITDNVFLLSLNILFAFHSLESPIDLNYLTGCNLFPLLIFTFEQLSAF